MTEKVLKILDHSASLVALASITSVAILRVGVVFLVFALVAWPFQQLVVRIQRRLYYKPVAKDTDTEEWEGW